MVLRMTNEQREEMLAKPWVGVLTVTAEDGRAPLATPIWYVYRPGGAVTILTSPRQRKARLIAGAGRFALNVQETATPYQYVTVEGPVVETRPATMDDRLAMARRYVPPEFVTAYIESNQERHAGNVVISMLPERWHTADYSDVVERLQA